MRSTHVRQGKFSLDQVVQCIRDSFALNVGASFVEHLRDDRAQYKLYTFHVERGNEDSYVMRVMAAQLLTTEQPPIVAVAWAGPNRKVQLPAETIQETVAAYCRAWGF
jgi:hypothetical protein